MLELVQVPAVDVLLEVKAPIGQVCSKVWITS